MGQTLTSIIKFTTFNIDKFTFCVGSQSDNFCVRSQNCDRIGFPFFVEITSNVLKNITCTPHLEPGPPVEALDELDLLPRGTVQLLLWGTVDDDVLGWRRWDHVPGPGRKKESGRSET